MPFAWKFIREDAALCHTRDRKWVAGEWQEITAPLQICEVGFHASVKARDALQYHDADRLVLARVEYDGEIVTGDDKIAARRMRVAWASTKEATRAAIMALCFAWTNRAIENAVAALRKDGLAAEADKLAAIPKVTDAASAEKARAASYAAFSAAASAAYSAASYAAFSAAACAAYYAAYYAASSARSPTAARSAAYYYYAAYSAEEKTQNDECDAAFAALEPKSHA